MNTCISVKKEHFDKLKKYRENQFKNPELKMLFIEATTLCNEHCRHCGSNCGDNSEKDILSTEEIIRCLQRIIGKVNVLPFVAITGGEPLIRKDIIELCKHISKLGFSWGMTSNGVLINQNVANQLMDAGMSTISISIDGLKNTHDWFRQTTGGYDRAINAVKILSDMNFKNVMVTTVVHKENIDELNEMLSIVKSTGCNTWRLVPVDPIGRAKGNDDIALTSEQYKYLINYVRHLRNTVTNMHITFSCNHFLGYEYERELRDWYFRCNAGLEVASIAYNGDILACLDIARDKRVVQGNIRKDDFYDTWINKFDIFRRYKATESETCKDCEYLSHCDGGGFHSWDLNNNKPEICICRIMEGK